ncbi:MAG: 5-guanidino-2-oxopentanoate decarboxylase [Pseudomonadota bacterium]
MTTIGEKLIRHLEAREVEFVFGIPGVHTIEHYKGLAGSSIRHITPRHEQGAGFMADGYARISGKPGVALVITGPGVSNILTAMAQSRADSIPMLVISAANPIHTFNQGLGCLHELPDQRATVDTVALHSFQIQTEDALDDAIEFAFKLFESERPGPVHIALPYEVAGLPVKKELPKLKQSSKPEADPNAIRQAAERLNASKQPLVLAGGGMRWYGVELTNLAEKLDCPVVTTTNGRGLMHNHGLAVHASPSLPAIRDLIEKSDTVLILGSEIGRTDYDMYATETMPDMHYSIRVDLSIEHLEKRHSDLKICADAGSFCRQLSESLERISRSGTNRAQLARKKAFDDLSAEMKFMTEMLEALRSTASKSIFVGDSTQAIYAGNLYYDHDRAGGWFNSSTGYGTLGFGIPAAIGASLAAPDERVICLTGDGGAQFSLPELMVATDENLPVAFIIWNNHGYKEIETSMVEAQVTPIGCDPSPPKFRLIADACGIPYLTSGLSAADIKNTMKQVANISGPVVYEIEF